MENFILLCSDNGQIEHVCFYTLTPNKSKNINSKDFYLLLSIQTYATLLQKCHEGRSLLWYGAMLAF